MESFCIKRGKRRHSSTGASGGVADKMFAPKLETHVEENSAIRHAITEGGCKELDSIYHDYQFIKSLSYPSQCSCCPNCKSRISRLQIMVNQLFSYISDYLPEELQEASHTSCPQTYQRDQKGNQFEIHPQRSAIGKIGNKSKQMVPQKTSNMRSSTRIVTTETERSKKIDERSLLTFSQKKDIVKQVQDCVKKGQKVSDVCARLNICDRSYQRWKRQLDSRELDEQEVSISAESSGYFIPNPDA